MQLYWMVKTYCRFARINQSPCKKAEMIVNGSSNGVWSNYR